MSENKKRELWITQNPDPLGAEYEFHFDKKEAESEGWDVVHFREVIPPEVKERPDSAGVWVNEIGAFIRVFESHTTRTFKYLTFGCFPSGKIDHLPKGEWIKVPNPHGDGQ